MKFYFSLALAAVTFFAGTHASQADAYYPGQYVQINSYDPVANGAVGMIIETNLWRPINSRKTVTVHYVGNDNYVHDEEFRAIKNSEVSLYPYAITNFANGEKIQITSNRYNAKGAVGTISSQDSGVLRIYYLASDGEMYIRPFNSNELATCPECILPTPPPRPQPTVVVPPAPRRDQCDNDSELSSYGGDWIRLPNGQCVYSPNVDYTWEPYRNGYWYWSTYGWTWHSYDPWGNYTDHYGVWRHYGNRWVWIRFEGSNYYWRPCGVTFFYTQQGIGWSPFYSGYSYGYNDGFNDGFWLGYQYGMHSHSSYHYGMTYVNYSHFSRPGQTFYNQNYIVTKGDVARYFNEATKNDRWGPVPGVPRNRITDPRNLDASVRAESLGYIQRQNGVGEIRETQIRSETRVVTTTDRTTGQRVDRPVNVVRPENPGATPPGAVTPRRTSETPAEQPRTQPAPRIEQPRPQPAPRIEQPRPQPAPRIEQPRPQPAPRIEQPRPQPAPRIEQPRPQPAPRPSAPRPSAPNNGGGNGSRSSGPGPRR